MTPDYKHARLMLEIAHRDLTALYHMHDTAQFDDAIFGFHAQQCIEKALKAWLSGLGVVYPKTHDLDELLRLLQDGGAHVSDSVLKLGIYTDFAVQYRYSDSNILDITLDRSEVFSHAQDLVKHVQELLG